MVLKRKQDIKKTCAAAAACTMALSLSASFPYSAAEVQAAQTMWKFDFGANGAASGYTAVSASDSYSSSKGYGFADTSSVKNVSAAGSSELSDAVQFTSTSTSNTFNVDLPNGLYEMNVKLGNTTRASVWAEGVLQIINMTGNNAVDTIQIPVTDGQLNLMVTEGKANTAFTLSTLELTKISDDPNMDQTIWVCGDSTVCNYYPLESSTQAGWAQMLGDYIDTDNFQIRNMAASGQYAKGFVDAGQFDAIEKYGKTGDYYIISIGINDTNYSNRDEYKQTVTDMTQKAKAIGMKVILVKQQGRADDISRSKLLSGRWYGDALDEIGAEEDVQVVDLFTSSQDYWLSIGQDEVYNLFMDGDTLHPNRAGASKLAELVSEEVTFTAINKEGVVIGEDENVTSAYIAGDVNHDGVINVIDLCFMKRALKDNSVSIIDNPEYDVTGDSLFNISDAEMMQDYLLKVIDKFNDNSNRYLAIDAAVNSGVSETTNAGSLTGTYINLDNQTGSSITWTVNVPEDGNYKLTFRNANGGTADRPMVLSLSGSEDTWRVSFPTTDSWTTWSTSSIVVPLTKGTQTITLTSATSDGGPNLDYLLLEKTDAKAAEPEEIIPEGAKQVENLDRGLIAANTGSGMLVSWRSLASDKSGTTFKLYKNGTLLSDFDSDAATNYMDSSGTAADVYTIDTYVNGTKTGTTESATVLANKNSGQSGAYFDISLNKPADQTMPDGTTCTYSPNDCSVADADGDGEYEIFLKWDPSNSQDNSKDGYTGTVIFDCYKLDGTQLWRIDLGKNIRAGAHYTQFMVYDYDGDGKAEFVCKTADGTTDSQGNVVGDASKDYRSSYGRILTGPEYLSLFDGETGKLLDTVDYKPGRGTVSDWGDDYGNRVDRFVAATAYLNGSTPSVVMGRGYYTRMALTAYDVVNDKLVERWAFDTGHDSSVPGYGDGNHNCMPADVDGDGKDEIVMGSAVIDDNGKLLYTSGLGHGDAMHVGDFDPDNPGVEIFMCHEEAGAGCGISLRDGKTGNILFRETASGDTGRCIADNLIAGNSSAEIVGSHNAVVYDTSGNVVCNWSDITKWGQSSVIYWTGDLERCVMDRTMIDKYGTGRVFTGNGVTYNNATKSNASISCDLFGDWREEVVFPTSDGTALRVFSTTFATDYKIYTLMQNPQYRAQVAGQNVAYNQPPHTDYFLGTGFDLPELPDVYTVSAP